MLSEAMLTDEKCVGILLQGAALLSHLAHGGLMLQGGWSKARQRYGRLLVDPPTPGKSAQSTQVTLYDLMSHLFRGGWTEDGSQILGRGRGRKLTNQLLRRWRHRLVEISPDRAVADIFEVAPFLWDKSFAGARTALVGCHQVNGRKHLWIAGPWKAQRRFEVAQDLEKIETLLRSAKARKLWTGSARMQQTQSPEELFAAGYFRNAIEIVKQQSDFDSKLLQLRCLIDLSELKAARKFLGAIAKSSLTADQTCRLTPVAVRLAGLRGDKVLGGDWVAHGLQAAGKHEVNRLRSYLVAAQAAWDRGDVSRMSDHLEKAAPAAEHPDLRLYWHKVKGLEALDRHDAVASLKHTQAALENRRAMSAVEAARRWSDLASARVLADDLEGAERACRHTVLLLRTSDGPLCDTLGSTNLAEVRLRRGSLKGVAETLETSMAENRRTGNVTGLIWDLGLWARLELALGRPAAALARCREAIHELDKKKASGHRETLNLLAARAHGWLGETNAAAELLSDIPESTLFELEVEERAAVWALAGQPERAAEEARGTPWEPFWVAHVSDLPPSLSFWSRLHQLEGFRAARLVFDCELARPNSVPASWVRRAVITFREIGASSFSDRLESRALSPWRALTTFLKAPKRSIHAAANLLHAAGYSGIHLKLRPNGDADNQSETTLIDGEGGRFQQELSHREGTLIVSSSIDDEVLDCLLNLLSRELQVDLPSESPEIVADTGGILGESPALVSALLRLDRLASTSLPLLILGETGTGKELAARRCHRNSERASGPFCPVNCAALQENLVQSELFGHTKGAFTGADGEHKGIFEAARGGTVFLDEVGELPADIQGNLLRVLQEREIRRLGESFDRKVDVRVIAATHRDLDAMVKAGTFREDLYYRLRFAQVELPPLRDRGDDILILTRHFIHAFTQQRSQPSLLLSPEAQKRLCSHDWRGNVRELKGVVEAACSLASNTTIEVEDLNLPEKSTPDDGKPIDEKIRAYEVRLLREALTAAGGNKAKAGRQLGMSRQALSYRLRKLGIR